ncbi:MAG: type II CRISPR RNA-guided endonuclease Cas9 [Thermodesulfobacteriota bacterium]
MGNSHESSFILGLDLGTNSVGWSLLGATADPEGRLHPAEVLDMGVRVFDAGVEGDIEAGKDASRNAERRDARLRRRQLDRKADRKTKVLTLLQAAGLLPPGATTRPGDRHRYLADIDRRLFDVMCARRPSIFTDGEQARQLFPYRLRTLALAEPLPPEAVGRSIYHLAQRRGFFSTRRSKKLDEKETGVVYGGIQALAREMDQAGAATYGALFAGRCPLERRIRGQWTSRAVLEKEFAAIWAAQKAKRPDLYTPDREKALLRAIFLQKLPGRQKALLGRCDLEPDCHRTPWAMLEAQRFRLIQQVNNLEIITEHGEVLPLTGEPRSLLVEALEKEGDLTFAQVRKLLGLAKNASFNLQRGGETRLPGNRTAATLRKALGERWDRLSAEDRGRLVNDVMGYEKDDKLAARAERAWGLDAAAARKLAEASLQQGYCSHSLRAIRKLLPLMEAGTRYGEARKTVYPEKPPRPATPFLPPAATTLGGLRNPLVLRTLTEMRKVVNAVIHVHGLPALIRVELGRDLKRPRAERQRRSQDIRGRERERHAAHAAIVKDHPHFTPRRSDIEKYLLAAECDFICPFTGQAFGWDHLFGPTPQVDVEHIIPYSRSLDNSFANKTLCFIRENREVKKNRTPFEAYGGGPRHAEILDRVRRFKAAPGVKAAKLARFQVEDADDFAEDFKNRQLNDTRYASRLAREYLAGLYGAGGERFVQVGSGMVTALLRRELKLNALLGGSDKNRGDHRHHALDALCVALTSPGVVKDLSTAAARAQETGRRGFAGFAEPWPGFLGRAREAVEGVVVSFRPSRKVAGPLHKETFYALRPGPDGEPACTVRKPLAALSRGEAGRIVDPVVRRAVAQAMAAAGTDNPAKAFAEGGASVAVPSRKRPDRPVPVRRVRIAVSVNPEKIGRRAPRHVERGANHHVAVFETVDGKGAPRWEGRLVTRLEAARRAGQGQPVVRRQEEGLGRFLFSLCGGDVVEVQENGASQLLRIRVLTLKKSGRIEIEGVAIRDARMKKDIRESGDWRYLTLDGLRKMGCRKVSISPLGRVSSAND